MIQTPRRNRWAAVLLQPRWLALTLFVFLFVPLAIYLGMWQFDRDDERSTFNQDLIAQFNSPTQTLSPNIAYGDLADWAPLVATGQFDNDVDILVRRRTQDGYSGFYVLTPFMTSMGQSVLVNRGWVRAVGPASMAPEFPSPPQGETQIEGRWRLAETAEGPIPTDLPDYQVLSVDPTQIAAAYPEVGGVMADGYFQANDALAMGQNDSLMAVNVPTLSSGPHLGYALQWLIFGSIAVVGWVLLLKREVRQK